MQLNQKMECQKCKNFVYPIVDRHEDEIKLINEPIRFRLPDYICPFCKQISTFMYYGD